MPLSPEAEEQLGLFAANANWHLLHPLDWERYFDFILGTHERNEDALPSEIRAFLMSAGGTDEAADEIADFYDQARDLLRYFDQQT